MTPKPTRSKLRRLLTSTPLLGLLAWGGGLVGIWYGVQSADQSPGVLVMAVTGWTLLFGLLARDTVSNLFGPVFVYEITRLGRRRLTFVLRFMYVLCILAILGMMYAAWLESLRYGYGPYGRYNRGMSTIEPGELSRFANEFFNVFVIFQYCVAVFLTPAYVAGTIADEKERKTLEFLLATDLQPREIIFGKVAARVTNLIIYVLAGLPIIAFLQLFGGIHPDLVLASTAATIISIIGAAGISIYFSTILRKPRDAIVMTYMVGGFYLIASYAAVAGMFAWQMGISRYPSMAIFDYFGMVIDCSGAIDLLQGVVEGFAAGNIVWSIGRMFIAVMGGGNPFTPTAINTELMRFTLFWGIATVLTIGTAILRLRPVALQQGSGGNKATRKAVRRAKDRPAIGDNPVAWKEVLVEGSNGGFFGMFMRVVTLFVVLGSAVAIFYFQLVDPFGGNLDEQWNRYLEAMSGWVRVMTGGITTLCILGVAIRASTSISGERDKDTWLSLISTPMSANEIVFGKWLGAMLSVRQLYFTLVLVWAWGLAIGAVEPVMILPTLLYFAIAVSTFAWMGLYWSVISRNSLIAVIRAFMMAMFMGGGFWLILACCAVPLEIMSYGGGGSRWLTGNAMQLFLGMTPSFAIGWLPLSPMSDQDLDPFDIHGYGSDNFIGYWAIPFGMIVWSGLCWHFYKLTQRNFAKVSLRKS